jgi:hypothetical protein
MLHLPVITTEFCTVAIFVILTHGKMFHTIFIGMFMIYLRAEFHMPSSCSSSSLIISIVQKVKYRFCMATMLFFYILQKYELKQRLYIFKRSVTTQNFEILH